MTATAIGKRIASARKDAGLTQVALGEMIGSSGDTVSKWERGDMPNPSAAIMVRIADACQTPIEWLLTGRGARDARRRVGT